MRLALQARLRPYGAAEYQLRLSAFCFRFFRSYPFVIRAEAALATASTGIGLRQPGMEHRVKSVMTVQNSGVT